MGTPGRAKAHPFPRPSGRRRLVSATASQKRYGPRATSACALAAVTLVGRRAAALAPLGGRRIGKGLAAVGLARPLVADNNIVVAPQEFVTVSQPDRAIDIGFAWLTAKLGERVSERLGQAAEFGRRIEAGSALALGEVVSALDRHAARLAEGVRRHV